MKAFNEINELNLVLTEEDVLATAKTVESVKQVYENSDSKSKVVVRLVMKAINDDDEDELF